MIDRRPEKIQRCPANKSRTSRRCSRRSSIIDCTWRSLFSWSPHICSFDWHRCCDGCWNERSDCGVVAYWLCWVDSATAEAFENEPASRIRPPEHSCWSARRQCDWKARSEWSLCCIRRTWTHCSSSTRRRTLNDPRTICCSFWAWAPENICPRLNWKSRERQSSRSTRTEWSALD